MSGLKSGKAQAAKRVKNAGSGICGCGLGSELKMTYLSSVRHPKRDVLIKQQFESVSALGFLPVLGLEIPRFHIPRARQHGII